VCALCVCVSAHPQDDQPYIIEANPRASRTVPFVAKAVGHPIAKYASLLMSGKTLKDINFTTVSQPAEHMLAEKHLQGGAVPESQRSCQPLQIPKPLPQHARMHTQHFACSGDTLGCARQQHHSAHKGGVGCPAQLQKLTGTSRDRA
jgi:hypothetical protein